MRQARPIAFVLALPLLGNALPGHAEVSADAVLDQYADLAHAMYEDALVTARDLQTAVDTLIEQPTEENLLAAREAWRAARVPYQQTEGFRFGNPLVDEWEGRVNAWPLDEGLIDYVDTDFYGEASDMNPLYGANIIASPVLQVGGQEVDASTITKALLQDELHEAGEVEANVATGYHAIEFLLWGQDLHGTGPGAGERPASDFDVENCTGDNCERRAEYLRVATALLIDDLEEMVDAWGEAGDARMAVIAGDDDTGLAMILTGLGSLSYGELAGERMQLGLMLHDPEEEHDCFADNTHNSHYYNQAGMMAIYTGEYQRVDGSRVSGPGLDDYALTHAPEVNARVLARMNDTLAAMQVMKDAADAGMAYDQMLAMDNPEGNAIIQGAVDELVGQARAIEDLVAELDLTITVEGSDSLDNPALVQ